MFTKHSPFAKHCVGPFFSFIGFPSSFHVSLANNFQIQRQPMRKIPYFAFNTSSFPLQKPFFLYEEGRNWSCWFMLTHVFVFAPTSLQRFDFAKFGEILLQKFPLKVKSHKSQRRETYTGISHTSFICSLWCHRRLWIKDTCLVMQKISPNRP